MRIFFSHGATRNYSHARSYSHSYTHTRTHTHTHLLAHTLIKHHPSHHRTEYLRLPKNDERLRVAASAAATPHSIIFCCAPSANMTTTWIDRSSHLLVLSTTADRQRQWYRPSVAEMSESNQAPLVIGYWMSDRKSQKLNWVEFSKVCRWVVVEDVCLT